jgi:hypothetical protein
MAVASPWLPREIATRMLERQHEVENMKTTYLATTAYIGGFLGREDGKRPSWFNRVRLPPVSSLSPDLQEHLSNACHVICMKVRQDATSEPTSRPVAVQGREGPVTAWQSGLLCARVLWRGLFAATAAKAPVAHTVTPIVFMAACDGLKQIAKKMLTQIWLELAQQFTAKTNKYHTMKSRPRWEVLEAIQYRVFCEEGGFSMSNEPGVSGTKPNSNLQDYLEEILALRFLVDSLTLSIQDAQEFIEQYTRRIHKRPPPRPKAGDVVAQQLAALKEKTVTRSP